MWIILMSIKTIIRDTVDLKCLQSSKTDTRDSVEGGYLQD